MVAAHRVGRCDRHDRVAGARQRVRARGVEVRATPAGDGFVLDGTKWHVPFARAATTLVVLARTGDAETDVDLFLVDLRPPG